MLYPSYQICICYLHIFLLILRKLTVAIGCYPPMTRDGNLAYRNSAKIENRLIVIPFLSLAIQQTVDIRDRE